MNKINDNPNINIPIFLGRIDEWQDVVVDLTQINHLLIAGFAGCGKSTLIHNILSNIIEYRNGESIKLALYDHKGIELSIYNGCPHLLIPVVTDDRKMEAMIKWANSEMKDRLNKFAYDSVRSISEYNNKALDLNHLRFPRIIIVLDGYSADNNDTNENLQNILINGRTVGIHVVLSLLDTRNILKFINLFPASCLFRSISYPRGIGISAKYFSLLSVGEFYYKSVFSDKPNKLSTPDIDFYSLEKDINKNRVNCSMATYSIETQKQIDKNDSYDPYSSYDIDGRDEYFAEAGRFIIDKDKASIGMLQRVLKIGFNRSARIMDQLADYGVVGEEEGTKPRKVLMSHEQFEKLLEELQNT